MNLTSQDDNWEIISEDYKMNTATYNLLHKTWKTTLKNLIKPNSNVLIINGGDQIIRNSFISSVSTTICDPKVFEFTQKDISEKLQTLPYLNCIDSLNYVNKLTLLDMTFKEAIEDECFKDKFDIIIVASAKNELEITDKLFIEYCYYYLKDNGLLFYQLSKEQYLKNLTFKTCIEYYFTEINRKLKNIPYLTTSNVAFTTYRKFSSLL